MKLEQSKHHSNKWPPQASSHHKPPIKPPSSLLWTSACSPGPTGTSGLRAPANLEASNKFHRAAVDGYVDMLCEASKRDTNLAAQDQHQLTPTLLAAHSGQLDALRILVGRGGDPERVSSAGSSALHLAAASNHLNCVSFLVNFGVNMWSLDNDLHTAKDVAAIEQHKQVLDYLDQMMAKQSAINTKSVQKLKEKAKVSAEKRIKSMRKAQLKAIKQVERDERLLAKMSNNRRLLKAAHSISDIKLVGRVGLQQPDGALNQAGDQQQAATLTSLINSKLQADLWSRRRKQPATAAKLLKELHFSHQPDLSSSSSSPSCSSSSTATAATSGYLSSSSARSILKMAGPTQECPFQPAALSSCLASFGSASSSSGAPRRPRYSDLVGLQANSKRGNKSTGGGPEQPVSSANSSVANRLRAIGGVSRKVHLKRLLFPSSSSEPNKNKPASEHYQSAGASNLTRARSEPDLCSVLRNSSASPHPATSDEEEEEEADDDEPEEADEDDQQQETASSTSVDSYSRQGVAPTPAPPPPPPPPPPLGQQSIGTSCPSAPGANLHDQKQLLTQCLSQLKMQHEAINRTDQQPPADCSIRPSRLRQQFNGAANSDELIQLNQLHAGQSPLRPSVIKHQQHLTRAQLDCSEPRVHSAGNSRLAAKSTTILSVDSIGSAGSFAQRNVPTNGSSTSSGASSCCSSSGQTRRADPGGQQHQQRQQVAADGALEEFLAGHGLAELAECLAEERIDLEALLLLTEDDLKSLNILLGPRRKLLNAIERHHRHLLGAGVSQQERDPTMAKSVVVDTQF